MTYVVTENCRKCRYTDCAAVCPVEAFHLLDEMMVINPEVCIDCGACVPACPVKAIYAEAAVPEKWKSYIEQNARECKNYPVVYKKMDPLPTARTIAEIEKDDAGA